MYRRRNRQGKIAFERLFNKSLRRKAKDFLESGTPVATLTKGILIAAAIGGVVAVGVMAPNLFKVFRIDSRERGRRLSPEGFKNARRSCYQLQKSGLIETFPDKKQNIVWRVTKKGENVLAKLFGIPQSVDESKKRMRIKAPFQWDGKWRIIFFDIPINFNAARDTLRRELRMLGCYQLQRSVLMHPFPCVREVLEVARRLKIVRYVEVCTVEDFSNKGAMLFFEQLLKQYKSDVD